MNSQPRILIVESDDVLRVLLFTILRHQPVAVDTARTPDEALSAIERCDYSLILIDLDLPDRGAEAFLDALPREEGIVVIAICDPANQTRLDSRIVSGVLHKPLELDPLAELVRECAMLAPPPVSTGCPPAESDLRARMLRDTSRAN